MRSLVRMVNAPPPITSINIKLFTAGPPDEDGLAPEQRKGLLWEVCRKLYCDGWVLDTAGYSTSFRVTLKVGAQCIAAVRHVSGF